jgi:hypothetical protein
MAASKSQVKPVTEFPTSTGMPPGNVTAPRNTPTPGVIVPARLHWHATAPAESLGNSPGADAR